MITLVHNVYMKGLLKQGFNAYINKYSVLGNVYGINSLQEIKISKG